MNYRKLVACVLAAWAVVLAYQTWRHCGSGRSVVPQVEHAPPQPAEGIRHRCPENCPRGGPCRWLSDWQARERTLKQWLAEADWSHDLRWVSLEEAQRWWRKRHIRWTKDLGLPVMPYAALEPGASCGCQACTEDPELHCTCRVPCPCATCSDGHASPQAPKQD